MDPSLMDELFERIANLEKNNKNVYNSPFLSVCFTILLIYRKKILISSQETAAFIYIIKGVGLHNSIKNIN